MSKRHCRKCGVELLSGENWTAGAAKAHSYLCTACRAEYSQKWHINNRERRRETHRRWVQENKDRMLWLQRRWRQENPHIQRFYEIRARDPHTTITPSWLKKRLGNGVCEVTGLALNFEDDFTHPLSAEVDRIDPAQGYTKENCRVVCRWFNRLRVNMPDEEAIERILQANLKQEDTEDEKEASF